MLTRYCEGSCMLLNWSQASNSMDEIQWEEEQTDVLPVFILIVSHGVNEVLFICLYKWMRMFCNICALGSLEESSLVSLQRKPGFGCYRHLKAGEIIILPREWRNFIFCSPSDTIGSVIHYWAPPIMGCAALFIFSTSLGNVNDGIFGYS